MENTESARRVMVLGTQNSRCQIIALLLRNTGMTVQVCDSADRALSILDEQQVDALLVDGRLTAPYSCCLPRVRLRPPGAPALHVVLLGASKGTDTQRWIAGLQEHGIRTHSIDLPDPMQTIELLAPLLDAHTASVVHSKVRVAEPKRQRTPSRPRSETSTVRESTRSSLPPRRERRPRSGSLRSPTPPPRESTKVLLPRLKREVQLARSADDFTMLGLPPDAPAKRVRQARERMLFRYGEYAKDDFYEPEIRALARTLVRRFEAIGDAPTAQAKPRVVRPEPERVAYTRGLELLEANQMTEARKYFTAAVNLNRYSPLYNAYLGWTTLMDCTLPEQQRQDKGMEMLRLANITGDHEPQAVFLLASGEAELGLLPQAVSRLTELVDQHADHAPSVALLKRLSGGRLG